MTTVAITRQCECSQAPVGYCHICGLGLCPDCVGICACQKAVCSECSETCDNCGSVYCSSCARYALCPDCGRPVYARQTLPKPQEELRSALAAGGFASVEDAALFFGYTYMDKERAPRDVDRALILGSALLSALARCAGFTL